MGGGTGRNLFISGLHENISTQDDIIQYNLQTQHNIVPEKWRVYMMTIEPFSLGSGTGIPLCLDFPAKSIPIQTERDKYERYTDENISENI